MTVYKIARKVRRLPLIISAAVVFFLAILIFSGLWTFKRSTNFFILSTVVLMIMSSWEYISLKTERVIIDEQDITYSRVLNKAKVAWPDIKECKLISGWASKPVVILLIIGSGINLRIDYSCFDNR